MQSKTAPDVSWVYAGCFGDLAQADAVYPLDEFIKGEDGLSEADIQDIFPALLPLGSWCGTLYGLPMEATNMALVYNRDLFKTAGLDPEAPPRNWQELRAFAEQLSTYQNGKIERVGLYPPSDPLGGFMVWQWRPFLWQAGGYVITTDQKRALFNSPAGVAALNLWKDLYETQQLRKFTADVDVAFASKFWTDRGICRDMRRC